MGRTATTRANGKRPAALTIGAALCVAATASAAIAVPSTGDVASNTLIRTSELGPFTPARVDPELARRVAADLAAKGKEFRFTPGGLASSGAARTVTVAVRVDEAAARAIGIRSAPAGADARPGTKPLAVAPTRYDLGAARGLGRFTRDTPAVGVGRATRLPDGVADVSMPDLAQFRPSPGAKNKPSRFEPRLSLEQERRSGRAPRTLQGLSEQSVDVGGAFRVTRNLDVTAGVRLEQDRARLAPLTDGTDDSQAVYLGTQIRF